MPTPKFTKSDFEFIADLLAELNITEDEAMIAADMLADTNPLFRRSVFIDRACPDADDYDLDDDDEVLWEDDLPTEQLTEQLATVIPFPTKIADDANAQ